MALLQNNAALDESIKEQGLLRADAGRKSRAIGELFEQWILRGCDWCWEKGIAYIEKPPEPMRPIKAYGDRRKGQFIAIYAKQAQPDFKGTLCDGSTVIFDAKSTSQDILKQSVVTEEQRKEFDRYEKMGAAAILWRFWILPTFTESPGAPGRKDRKSLGAGILNGMI